MVQPDLTVICDEAKLTEQGVSSAPERVVEIVSPDSGFHDRGREFDLYERLVISERNRKSADQWRDFVKTRQRLRFAG